jgi:hypothetical protein
MVGRVADCMGNHWNGALKEQAMCAMSVDIISLIASIRSGA